ncbi:MAG: heme biosynthesis protein HemY [Rhodomicrobiaceae bacterium]
MLRTLIYLLLLAVLAFGFAWFAEHPGELTLDWQSYQIEVSLVVYIAAFLLAAAALFFLVSFVFGLLGSPGRLRRHLQERRRARGYTALRRGIFAVGAGDEATAARYAIEARRALGNEPLTALLQAQSAQLSGDHRTAQRLFEAMSEKPETRLLGLRGLFLEASREGQMEAARQYAGRAISLNPAVPWPVHALFDMQCRIRNWQGALETLAIARNHRHIDRRTHDRRRAVLLTAQAQELEESQPERAVELALEAHRLAPEFVPAAVIAGRTLASQGSTNKAARVLAKTWQYNPHPDLALNYAYARPGDSPRDRLGRIRSLIVMTPEDPEALIALATAAIDAQDWQEAREALQPLLGKNPTTRVCALMARIEGGEKRDAGRVREWLARAVRARRDAVWMADGVISNEWQPISPVTGALDAFQWRVPPDQAKTAEGDPLFDEVAALSQEMEAVARKIRDAGRDNDEPSGADGAEPLTITVKVEEADAAVTPPPKPEMTEPREKAGDDGKDAKQSAAPAAAAAIEAVPVDPPRPDSGTAAVPTDTSAAKATESGGTVPAKSETEMPAAQTGSATAVAAPRPAPASSQGKKTEPEIFVPSRPPDDPGPEPNDFDETSSRFSRFRSH